MTAYRSDMTTSATEPRERRTSRPNVNAVAKAAGVSNATVSRVINQPELVAPETRERVTKAMASLNYHVNVAASSLRRGHGKSVSLVVASMAQPWYTKLVRALRAEITKHGYSTLLYDLEHNSQSLLRYLQTAAHEGASGVILATGDFIDSPEVVAAMKYAHETTPMVVIGQQIEGAPWPTVQFDDVEGSYKATMALAKQAQGRVAFLGRLKNSYLAGERLKGYLMAMNEIGTDPTPWIWDMSGFGYAAGYEIVSEHLRTRTMPNALLAVNDEIALGAARAISDAGLTIPGDIQLLGYGNTDFLSYVVPSLSSVGGSAGDVAEIATVALWSAFEGHTYQPLTILKRSLIHRESTMPDTA